MTSTDLHAMLEDHAHLSERLSAGWEALGDLDCHQPHDIQQLQDWFREQIREPIEFQETRVFPALLEIEPEAAPVIRDARKQHTAILAACGGLFVELAYCISSRNGTEHVCAARERGSVILDEVLGRLATREQRLLPLLRVHQQSLAARI